MTRVIAQLESENHNLNKEFMAYKEKVETKKMVEDARIMLTDMKIDKLVSHFNETYYNNPAFGDVFGDVESMNG